MWALKLMYIKLPMHLFFLWRWKSWIYGRKYALLGPVKGVGPEFKTFLGPGMGRAKRVPFGPKKVVMHISRQKSIMSRSIKTTGALVVIITDTWNSLPFLSSTVSMTHFLLRGLRKQKIF